MAPQRPERALSTTNEAKIRRLYEVLLDRWNQRDARGFASLFTEYGNVIGFDGSQVNGRADVESHLAEIFKDHQTAAYVAKVREVRLIASGAALLRGVVGMIPPGQADINPEANAVQTLVAANHGGGWQIELFQNTPAAWHWHPDARQALTDELRQLL